MKIFISWSGEVSKKTAEVLKKWIPFFFESAEVFFSPEDIEKGQNWNKKITEELASCNYGIVCLTSGNMNAPWINFEAGAIAKAFDSRVTALLVDVNPSDIQGPLSMFQATKLVKNEMHLLIKNINKNLDQPRNDTILHDLFENLWGKMEKDFNNITCNISEKPKTKEQNQENDILENILRAVREQSRILNNLESFLPKEYLSSVIHNKTKYNIDVIGLDNYVNALLGRIENILDEKEDLPKKIGDYMVDILTCTKQMTESQRIMDKSIISKIDRLILIAQIPYFLRR